MTTDGPDLTGLLVGDGDDDLDARLDAGLDAYNLQALGMDDRRGHPPGRRGRRPPAEAARGLIRSGPGTPVDGPTDVRPFSGPGAWVTPADASVDVFGLHRGAELAGHADPAPDPCPAKRAAWASSTRRTWTDSGRVPPSSATSSSQQSTAV